jgi:phosphatidylserine/phosphatidylglycerophosphate/cardiolipin synthase-like enzyme/regulation of enolase protein 1 (concanavalin A-like superfamily)
MKNVGVARYCFLVVLSVLATSTAARAADTLCDPSAVNCRTQILTLIQNEQVGLDVAFWFMQDARYSAEIVRRWQAGVPVRVIVDPRANPTYDGNEAIIAQLQQAGIPLRKRTASGILHWKLMLFAGQDKVQFGSANYSPDAFVPVTPYTNYVAETIIVTDDPAVVNSFKTKFDDAWTDTSSYTNVANISGALTRTYPTFPIDSSMNFPPSQDYGARAVGRYNAENLKLDAIMYRITDQRHTNALIAAKGRNVPVRLITENDQYRDPDYLWDSWNVDRMYAAGIPIRWRGHDGQNHEKVILLYGQNMTIFGSSNWTSASATSQAEHNYFTTKNAIFQWFSDQFDRMWNNERAAETEPFTPLPPTTPAVRAPANGSITSTTTSATLTWYGGPWAHNYDVYFGTNSASLPKVGSNLNLGPSTSSTTNQKFAVSNLAPGTTYYWKVVSKTMAGLSATGAVWSFTTSGGVSGNLPSGWSHQDVGSVGVAGSASYNGGVFAVNGAGADIWGTADAFHYAFQSMTGNGQMTARVASVANVAAWTKAGVMIRASTAANAAMAIMLVSPSKGTALQYRTSTGASAANIAGPVATAPYWVRIVRSGNAITGYVSSNGTSWTTVGTVNLTLGSTVQIGLAVSSHNSSRLATATFDNVSR